MQTLSFTLDSNRNRIHNLAAILQGHMVQHGYQQIETPIIENADLFLAKAGDQVAEKLFTFERHGHNLALRPEFTAAAAHLFAQRGEAKVVRWQFTGPIFIDDPHNPNGRYQQHSTGAELIGMSGAASDAEIIAMAANGLLSQGFHDLKVVIGHAGLTRHLLARFALDVRTQRFILNRRKLLQLGTDGKDRLLKEVDQYFPDVDTLPHSDAALLEADTQQMLNVLLDTTRRGETMGGRDRADIARRLLQKRQQASQRENIFAAIDFLEQWMSIQTEAQQAWDIMLPMLGQDTKAHTIYDEWRTTIEVLSAYNIPADRIVIHPDLARTWDYYTGVVFELKAQDGTQLGGGGRYDELIRLIGGGPDTPAVGFAYDLEAIVQLLPAPQATNVRPAVQLWSNEATWTARWAHALRHEGISVQLANTGEASEVILIDDMGHLHLAGKMYTLHDIGALLTAFK